MVIAIPNHNSFVLLCRVFVLENGKNDAMYVNISMQKADGPRRNLKVNLLVRVILVDRSVMAQVLIYEQ